jgi:fructokinase
MYTNSRDVKLMFGVEYDVSALTGRKAMRIGIDLGGTKISAMAIDQDGLPRKSLRVTTPRDSYDATINVICNLVHDLDEAFEDRAHVGLATPGAVDPVAGYVKNANATWLIGTAIHTDLARRLGRPVRIANDADCFALSEASDGAAAGESPVVGVILGTGVGGGIVVNGALLHGPNAIAGEWGHNPLPRMTGDEAPGPACYCGRRGCIETFLSGPALSADHARATGADAVDAETVAARADDGDAQAKAAMERYLDRLGRALAGVINVVDPTVVVLGGGLSRIERLYRDLPEVLAPHVFTDHLRTQIRPPRHGDDSGVRGAAHLWSAAEVGR